MAIPVICERLTPEARDFLTALRELASLRPPESAPTPRWPVTPTPPPPAPRSVVEVLEGYLHVVQLFQANTRHFIAIMHAQITPLQRIRTNQAAPSHVRWVARTQVRISRSMLRELHDFFERLNGWASLIRRDLYAARRRNLVQPIGDPLAHPWVSTLVAEGTHYMAQLGEIVDQWPSVENQRFLVRNAQYYPDHGPGCPIQSAGARPPEPPEPPAPGAGSLGVMAAETEGPPAISNVRQAYDSDCAIYARMFAYADPIDGDLNRRRYPFANEEDGRVDFQAHVPIACTSPESDWTLVGFIGLYAVAGSLCGALGPLGAPLGTLAFGGAGALIGSAVRPYDAAWQGYTANFYSSAGATQVWKTWFFYGWRQSSSIDQALEVDGIKDASRFPNFADDSSVRVWKTWRSGSAPERAPEPERLEIDAAKANGQDDHEAPNLRTVDRLIQTLASFEAPGIGAVALPADPAPSGSPSAKSPLLAVPAA